MKFGKDITDVPGVRVGSAQDEEALTGCTVILCEAGAVGGVDQRGGSPGTRETDLLRPLHMVEQVHAILLTGGSAFGLDAATGVMRYLEEHKVGFDVGVTKVPIVPGAVIFDLLLGRADIRPDAEMGYQACLNAGDSPIRQGNVGAGAGASVGKLLGPFQSTKTGLGSASISLENGLVVGALMVVNAFGEVIDPKSGAILAGVRPMPGMPIPPAASAGSGAPSPFLPSLDLFIQFTAQDSLSFKNANNTVIGVVATNAALNKEQANLVAQMAQDGVARAIRPAHTLVDGDTLFAISTGNGKADVSLVGALAAEVVSQAILQAAINAKPAGGLPSAVSL